MIKNNLRGIKYVVIRLIIFFFSTLSYAQVPESGKWELFVNDVSQNKLVRDTFLFQSFEEQPSDTWNYSTSGSVSRVDVSSLGIRGQGGSYSLTLSPGSSVTFEDIEPSSFFMDVCINVTFAAKALRKGDQLFVNALRNGQNEGWEWCRSNSNNTYYSFNYRTIATNPDKKSNPIQVSGNPSNISLNTPATNKGEFYCIDSAYAFGYIPEYSLFNGDGDWENISKWTHLPALRHRNALLKGNATVTSDIQCNEVYVSDGCLSVATKACLVVNNLILYSSGVNNASFLADGEIVVNGCVTVNKTFQEKGQWYFISFPFDVYKSGVSPDFTLEDDTPNDGGNYYYVRTYNGDKRALNGNTGDNWDVLKLNDVSDEFPVFEKNKGYLIALDDKATKQTLQFSSRAEALPEDFGKCKILPVQASQSGDEEDRGWFLCGNPLSSSLSLRNIEPNSLLDGNIYVYENGRYKSYPIGSNYSLPPLSAFFVKTKEDTELIIDNTFKADDSILLSVLSSVSDMNKEPEANVTSLDNSPAFPPVSSYINENVLILENIPSKGIMHLFDSSGHRLLQKEIEKGTSYITFTYTPGLYIINIETECYRGCCKVIKIR
ncbi:T9SS type A sorting domain-containing protein [Parabacteroides bouchesdurhonensis]|uniref:T9SS type A sorting domain-containing protein n=1 Tax=Parabacteroides bouchesdurhonensis TaxID=1936995 RepID=UPI000C8588A8|nr:T9SS type A sorting domain-containing protein [Parabacteroides bouchesdurhonensis]